MLWFRYQKQLEEERAELDRLHQDRLNRLRQREEALQVRAGGYREGWRHSRKAERMLKGGGVVQSFGFISRGGGTCGSNYEDGW
jgi:hypothetical protein